MIKYNNIVLVRFKEIKSKMWKVVLKILWEILVSFQNPYHNTKSIGILENRMYLNWYFTWWYWKIENCCFLSTNQAIKNKIFNICV